MEGEGRGGNGGGGKARFLEGFLKDSENLPEPFSREPINGSPRLICIKWNNLIGLPGLHASD